MTSPPAVAPGLFQLPGCSAWFDWSPGPSRCCGSAAFAVVRYRPPRPRNAPPDADPPAEATAIVCPRCRLLTLERVEYLTLLGSFDLLAGVYRPWPEPAPAFPGELNRHLTELEAVCA